MRMKFILAPSAIADLESIIIFYRVFSDVVEIVRIVDARHNILDLFRDER